MLPWLIWNEYSSEIGVKPGEGCVDKLTFRNLREEILLGFVIVPVTEAVSSL